MHHGDKTTTLTCCKSLAQRLQPQSINVGHSVVAWQSVARRSSRVMPNALSPGTLHGLLCVVMQCCRRGQHPLVSRITRHTSVGRVQPAPPPRLHTAICMAILLWGLYPSISKSSKVKESISVLAGLIRSFCSAAGEGHHQGRAVDTQARGRDGLQLDSNSHLFSPNHVLSFFLLSPLGLRITLAPFPPTHSTICCATGSKTRLD